MFCRTAGAVFAFGTAASRKRAAAAADTHDLAELSRATGGTRLAILGSFGGPMSTFLHDARFALRMLWKDRRFTLAALIALALGIGATTAIYTVVDAVLLRPLPFSDPAQLVDLQSVGRNGPGASSFPDYVDFRDRNHTLAGIAAYTDSEVVLTGSGDPRHLESESVTPNLFTVLGAQPMLGRGFNAADAVVGAPAIILSHALWQGHYRGDPEIIGRSVSLDGQQAVVVGVMPAGFHFPIGANDSPPMIYLPFGRDPNDPSSAAARGMHMFKLVARRTPTATTAQVQADLDAVVATMHTDHPGESEDKNLSVQVHELREQIVGPVRPALLLLLIAVACVLVIACANVAGLLLARATVRQREVAIRSTLGATRGRIMRQLLTESALLGVGGGAIGLLLALWLIDLLLVLVTPNLPHVHGVAVDGRVLAVTMGLSMVSSMAFGLMPALHASRVDLQESLKESSRSTSHASRKSRNALLVAEIATALVLLFGAGLALRSFVGLRKVDTGFRADGLVMAQVDLPARYPKEIDAVRYYRALARELASLPGADAIGLGAPMPFSHTGLRASVHKSGQPTSSSLSAARLQGVSPSYFATMGIPLVRGRNFTTADDDEHAAPVLIVSQEFARLLYGAEDPIGKRVFIGYSAFTENTPGTDCEIIGVVGDIRRDTLLRAPQPSMYGTLARMPMGSVGVIARGRTPGALIPALRQTILSLDKDLPPTVLEPMDSLLEDTIATQRMLMVLMGVFAGIALLLATIGIYGVMSYTVTQRRREIGIRVAVGARLEQILKLVLGESLKLALLGVVIGAIAALMLARLGRSLLYGVSGADPLTLVAVAALLVAVSLAASFIPAWRATRIDPMEALRDE
jgi:putative ABC transport system permease protein